MKTSSSKSASSSCLSASSSFQCLFEVCFAQMCDCFMKSFTHSFHLRLQFTLLHSPTQEGRKSWHFKKIVYGIWRCTLFVRWLDRWRYGVTPLYTPQCFCPSRRSWPRTFLRPAGSSPSRPKCKPPHSQLCYNHRKRERFLLHGISYWLHLIKPSLPSSPPQFPPSHEEEKR